MYIRAGQCIGSISESSVATFGAQGVKLPEFSRGDLHFLLSSLDPSEHANMAQNYPRVASA